ncbi:MAG: hypothetical protein ABEJ87_05110 [Candidatus Nanohalobium sp.]
MPDQPEEVGPQQAMQMFQQKLGNLELTVHALLSVLEENDVVDQEEINEEAQAIVEEMQEQQAQAAEGLGDLENELEDDE